MEGSPVGHGATQLLAVGTAATADPGRLGPWSASRDEDDQDQSVIPLRCLRQHGAERQGWPT